MRLAIVLSLVLLAGCTGEAKLVTEAKQVGQSLEVKVNVDPATKGTLQFKGNPAFEKLGVLQVEAGRTLEVSVPLAGVPRGKHQVTMEFVGEGRGLAKKVVANRTLAFERGAIEPTLRLVAVPKPGVPTITCKGALCGSGTRIPFGADAKIDVDLTECDGCEVVVGAQKIAVRGPHTVASIDLTSSIANAPGANLAGLSDMKIPFNITLEGQTSEVHFEALASVLAGSVLRRVAQGPLAFPEDTAGSAPKSVAIVRSEANRGVHRTVGTAARVRDYDLIGLATGSEVNLGTCGVYVNTVTKEKKILPHKGVSFDITMYDRRTGRTIGRRSFPPENTGCSQQYTGGASYGSSFPSEAAIEAWARSFLK